jgi:hypothetical protein
MPPPELQAGSRIPFEGFVDRFTFISLIHLVYNSYLAVRKRLAINLRDHWQF